MMLAAVPNVLFEQSHALANLDYNGVQVGNVERINCGVCILLNTFQYGVHASQSKEHDIDLFLFSLTILHNQVEDLVNYITLRDFSLNSEETKGSLEGLHVSYLQHFD